MRKLVGLVVPFALFSGSLVACGEDEPPPPVVCPSAQQQALQTAFEPFGSAPNFFAPPKCFGDPFGAPLCGWVPNGPALNGTNLAGGILTSAAYAGMKSADGRAVTTASIVAGELTLARDGAPVDPVGVTFTGKWLGPARDSRAVELRIEAVHAEGAIKTYDIVYRDAAEAAAAAANPACAAPQWKAICPAADAAATHPARAMLIDALWSYEAGEPGNGGRSASTTEFTIACEGVGAIAKCASIGYAPWAAQPGCQGDPAACTLVRHHEACVRALRADFCNNGFPLTNPNVPINVYDTLVVREDILASKGEASWDETGSLCIAQTRLDAITQKRDGSMLKVLDYINEVCPGKFTATGRGNWGGQCRPEHATKPDREQVFTEFAPAP